MAGLGKPGKPSNWLVFYDAIKKYPKFEQLKNFIDEAKKVKETEQGKLRQQQFQEYLKKQAEKSSKGQKKLNKELSMLMSQH